MHTISKLLPALTLLVSLPGHAALTVFACEPEWRALTKELAPEATVYSATTALQDPHHIQAKPGLIAKMRKADLVFCSGAELEVGWLPALQMKSANPKVQSTSKGLFYAADQVETIGKLDHVDPTMGDVHPQGNPHLHLDPYRVEKIAQAFTDRLINADAKNADQYQKNLEAFQKKWQAKIKEWEEQAKPLKSKNLVAYHSNFDYFFQWLGINVVGDLEPKPGLPPSPQHLSSLLNMSRQKKVDAVVYASYQDSEGARWLSERIGVPVVELPMSVGGNSQSNDLYSLYDNLISQLKSATEK